MQNISEEEFTKLGQLIELATELKELVSPGVALHAPKQEAEKQVMADYDKFDDVVANDGLDVAKLAEYSSAILYSFLDANGKVCTGRLYKYPKFLELFGADDMVKVSYYDVLAKFCPEKPRNLPTGTGKMTVWPNSWVGFLQRTLILPGN